MINYLVSIKYMVAGYAVIFVALALYLVSLIVRWKKLKRDLQMFSEMRKRP